MIAQRFRALGWVAGVATAATGLYLVSLQVAATRGKLEAVERQIASTDRDMRALQTELGTRASLRQLEKWNGEVLALSAPRADQFLHGAVQLAALDASALDGKANDTPAVMAAVASAPAPPAVADEPKLQHATFEKPADPPKPVKVALLSTVSLTMLADKERRVRP